MSYRFVKITSLYRDFLKHYYHLNPNIKSENYEVQLNHLMAQCFGWADYYSEHLKSLGAESYEIVANAFPLQNEWAKENGSSATGLDIVVDQLKKLKPDVVFFQDSYKFNGNFITELRAKIPSIKLIIGFCCTIFNNQYLEQFRAFDFMFVCSPLFANRFKEFGLKTYTIYHAFEESILERVKINNPYPEVDFLFVGSFIPGADGHVVRKQIVDELIASKINIEIYSNILTIKPLDLFLRGSAYIASEILKKTGLNSLAKSLPGIKKAYYLNEIPKNVENISAIKKITKPPLFGLEMFKALYHSKIGFNVHGTAAEGYAANMRLFEVTGIGSCLVTDWKKNINDLFEEDKEVVTFKTAAECTEKVKWLLDHPSEREAIAKAGQNRTLRDHNYKIRAEFMHNIICEELLSK